jgi:hypothetical protein
VQDEVDDAGWTKEAMDGLLDLALEENGVPMDEECDLLNVKFTILSIDHGETERIFRQLGNLDILTREMVSKKMLLAVAISKINGRRADDQVVHHFLDRSPPVIVEYLFDTFKSLREQQNTRLGKLRVELKKGRASPLSDSGGG